MSLYYPTETNAVQKTLDAALLAGATTAVTLNNVTNIQNKPGVFVVDRVDANGTATPSKREYIAYTAVSGSTLTGLTRNADGSGSDQDHSVGAIVEFVSDVLQQQKIINILDGTDSGAILTTPVIVNLVGNDGWIKATDTWTYASATTFTIAGVDRTAMFPKGTKIKLTQTTTKYFYVVGSAFSTNTTITITGGTDYTLANAAITSPYYSYASCPQGHPIWFNFAFTPVWNASAVPTGTPSTLDNKLMISGSSCTVDVYHDGYAAGTGVTAFSFTLPVVPLFSGSASGAITAGPSLNTCYSNHTTTIGRVYCSSVAATRVSFGATYAF